MKTISLTPFWGRYCKITAAIALPVLLLLAACNNNSSKETGGARKPDTERADSATRQITDQPDVNDLLTIATMTEDADGKTVEFRFYERQAIYKLDKTNKAYSANMDMLKQSFKNNTPVRFSINPARLSVSNITRATDEEIRAYNTGNGFNSPNMKIKGAAPVPIDVTKIDTSVFNKADYQSRFSVLQLCRNVVPDYATLVNIFNYCASQGCNNPPPYTITNCIPFQYVKDGCYARAHKMRQMISQKFGYCVEKVFSFAEGYPKKLAVKANLWGGCCVEWWYHVVPLLRMNVKAGNYTFQICYVIDPGMFTTPVTLSTWLQAQKNTTCNPNATVTSYSIQPGSAYWPMGSSASFGTDPGYVDTEATLIAYKNRVTCN